MRINLKTLLAGGLLLAVLVAAVWIYLERAASRAALEALPQPDFTDVEPQVVQRIRELEEQVRADPRSPEAWAELAMVLDIHDFKREAIPCYEQALALRPDEFRWQYFYTIALSETGDTRAGAAFERCLELRGDYGPLFVLYGRWLFEGGRLEEAKRAFQRAQELGPQNPHVYVGLGRLALAQGNLDESVELLEQAVELAPQYREAHGLLAEAYRRLGQPERSAEEMAVAQRLPEIAPLADPVYEELIQKGISAFWYRERGLVYQAMGRLEQAVQEFQMALRLKPDPKGHKYVADLLSQLGRPAEALPHYRQAAALNPRDLEAYVGVARALLAIGRTDEAYMWLDKTLRLNPTYPEAYLGLSDYYLKKGQQREAIAILYRGLRVTRGFMPIALELAWLLATSPDPALRNGIQALELAEATCKQLNYQNVRALDVLAAAYAENGRFQKAAEAARKAVQLAQANQPPELIQAIQNRLRLYENGRPFRRTSEIY